MVPGFALRSPQEKEAIRQQIGHMADQLPAQLGPPPSMVAQLQHGDVFRMKDGYRGQGTYVVTEVDGPKRAVSAVDG
jgi:hypothetical protein